MTKKAQNIYKQYEERITIHVEYFRTHPKDFDWTWKYTKEIYEEFRDMISGMYLFNLMKESDYNEILDKALEKYEEMDKQLFEIRMSA